MAKKWASLNGARAVVAVCALCLSLAMLTDIAAFAVFAFSLQLPMLTNSAAFAVLARALPFSMFAQGATIAVLAVGPPLPMFAEGATAAVFAKIFMLPMLTNCATLAVLAMTFPLPMLTHGFPATFFTIRLRLAMRAFFLDAFAELSVETVEVAQSPWSRQASQQAKTPQVVSMRAGKWAYA